MPVTAKLLTATQGAIGNHLLVEFLDGAEVSTHKYRDYRGSPTEFVDHIRSEVGQREDVKGYDFSQFVGSTIDITPPVVVPPVPPVVDPPTAEETARKEWFDDYYQLRGLLRLTETVPALLTTQAQTAIANLRTSLESNWLNSYLGGV